jgi:hypothetical protein
LLAAIVVAGVGAYATVRNQLRLLWDTEVSVVAWDDVLAQGLPPTPRIQANGVCLDWEQARSVTRTRKVGSKPSVRTETYEEWYVPVVAWPPGARRPSPYVLEGSRPDAGSDCSEPRSLALHVWSLPSGRTSLRLGWPRGLELVLPLALASFAPAWMLAAIPTRVGRTVSGVLGWILLGVAGFTLWGMVLAVVEAVRRAAA